MIAGLGAAYFVQAILVGLWELIKSPFNKRNSRPGQHGAFGQRRKLSDYGNQLFAKQKLRFYYGDLTANNNNVLVDKIFSKYTTL